MLVYPVSVFELISYFIVMAPDAILKFIRTVAVVTALHLLQNILLLPSKLAALMLR